VISDLGGSHVVCGTTLITADELLAMGDIGRCELIYGELVRLQPAELEHGAVAMRLVLCSGSCR